MEQIIKFLETELKKGKKQNPVWLASYSQKESIEISQENIKQIVKTLENVEKLKKICDNGLKNHSNYLINAWKILDILEGNDDGKF